MEDFKYGNCTHSEKMETGEDFDSESKAEVLADNNNNFVLKSHGVGKYGRCLGTIYIEGKNINEKLLAEGLAEEYK